MEGDNQIVPVTPLGEAKILAEIWNLGTDEVRGPAIIANEFGKGRTIYVSGSLEADYAGSRVKSTRELLGSIVKYLGANAPQPFRSRLPLESMAFCGSRRTAISRCGCSRMWGLRTRRRGACGRNIFPSVTSRSRFEFPRQACGANDVAAFGRAGPVVSR